MVEGFSDTIARFFYGNISSLFFELFDDLEHGVGGAGEIAAEFRLKHRQVVQVIPRDKGGGWTEIEEFLNMSEAGTFMVVNVGEAEVRTVADGGNLGVVLQDIADKGVGAGDAFFRSSDEADGTCIWNNGDIVIGADFTFDLFEEGSVATEEGLVGIGAWLIPFFEGVGLLVFDLMNFSFDGDNPVWEEGSLMKDKSLLEAFPRTSRGNDPGDGGGFASFDEPCKKVWSERSCGVFACEGAVEIGANEEWLQWGRLNS
jgi:hypothetical protein